MKTEIKRIFISDLPETCTKEELESRFNKYGEVSSVEIKERKELGPSNKSLFFSYVNLLTDDKKTNKCLQELSGTKWNGHYVQLQIARESFLERLKREREENENVQTNTLGKDKPKIAYIKASPVQNGTQSIKKVQKYKSSESSENESVSDSGNIITKKIKTDTTLEVADCKITQPSEELDIVIKNNKGKSVDKSGLKIPSFGKEAIFKFSKEKNKNKINDSKANLKRLQSLRDMKKEYEVQKSVIKNALSNVDKTSNNKIIFTDNENNVSSFIPTSTINEIQKFSLLNDKSYSDDESDFEEHFKNKEQFHGKNGQKLLELQSKYKHDKRFSLNEKFIEEDFENKSLEIEEISEDALEAEKQVQLKILEEVLGKKGSTRIQTNKNSTKKKMLRFDPSHPDHLNLELTVSMSDEKKNKKEKRNKVDQQQLEKEEPQVSKEIFYKVTDSLKESLEEKRQFSLLNMFGKAEDVKDVEEQVEKDIKRNTLINEQNPFKYDSSNDEDETEDIPYNDEAESAKLTKPFEPKINRTTRSVFWTEPFFFKPDDYRLQEGFDFIKKVKIEDKEFPKIRRELKGIVKAKIRNNERKNKMFKKKLGGSKRRKHIRIKKALKR